MTEASASSKLYGLLASFETPEALVRAAEKTREAGYKRFESYSPFPIHGLAEAQGFQEKTIPWIIFVSGVLGAAGGFGLQWYINVVDYPLNVGGRPYLSWPHFIPVTFECSVLLAAFGAIISLFGFCGLPRPHHPLFNEPKFLRASQDGFFMCIEAADEGFELSATKRFMENLGATAVDEVEDDEPGY